MSGGRAAPTRRGATGPLTTGPRTTRRATTRPTTTRPTTTRGATTASARESPGRLLPGWGSAPSCLGRSCVPGVGVLPPDDVERVPPGVRRFRDVGRGASVREDLWPKPCEVSLPCEDHRLSLRVDRGGRTGGPSHPSVGTPVVRRVPGVGSDGSGTLQWQEGRGRDTCVRSRGPLQEYPSPEGLTRDTEMVVNGRQ